MIRIRTFGAGVPREFLSHVGMMVAMTLAAASSGDLSVRPGVPRFSQLVGLVWRAVESSST